MKLILILVFLLVIVSANAANVDKKVQDSLDKNDTVRVIVYLKDENLNSLSQNIQLRYKYFTLDGYSAIVNKDGLEELKKDNNVKDIFLDQALHIDLQDALPLTNVNLVKSKLINNFNLTGINQTICILDTGINYSHPDLGGCFGKGCKVVDGKNFVNNSNDTYDNNGHGTHVSGIAAGRYGVAPDANIVMIKVCDDLGICYESDISSGIDYCNDKKKKYNINVISISIGGGLYSDYCNDLSLTSIINKAVRNNITVAIATGNGGSDNKISYPSCVQNATAVSSSTKQDEISSFSNRNSLVKIFAPGSNINSTWLNGYRELSGTSMAAPFVSGAVALLQEYKQKESNRILSVKEVENALKNSDKNLTEDGINYIRLNADKALISLDIKKPSFNILIYPNPSNLTINKVSINFSALDTNLDSVIVNITYPNGSLLFNSRNNFTLNPLNVLGKYSVNFFANDSNGNFNSSSYNLTILNPEIPIVTLNYPLDNSNLSNSSVDFNCSFTEDKNLKNATLYINSFANSTLNVTGKVNSTEFNLKLLDGNYVWNCLAFDNSSNSAFASSNFSFNIDTLSPSINTSLDSVSFNSASIIFNTDEITNATIYYNDLKQDDVNFVNNHLFNLNSLNANTVYYYNISACDLVNNCNSSTSSFTTSSAPSPGPSGAGGGGGSSGGGNSNFVTSNPIINTTPNAPIVLKILNKTKEENKTVIGNNINNLTNPILTEKAPGFLAFTGKTIGENLQTPTGKTILSVLVLILIIIAVNFFVLKKKK